MRRWWGRPAPGPLRLRAAPPGSAPWKFRPVVRHFAPFPMHPRLLSHTPTLTIQYDPVNECLLARWSSEQTLGSLRAGYTLLLEKMQRHACSRLLDDHRQLHLLWADLADWFGTTWAPRARQAGLTAHAVVYARYFFARSSTELALRRVRGSGLTAGFDTEEAALRALLTA